MEATKVTRSISRFITGFSVMAAFTLALALPGSALAQRGPAARLGSVQHQQQMQIRQGVQSGKLNKKEAARLEKGEKTIQATEQQDKAKGPLTGAEANQLKQETQRENAAIKHAEGGSTDRNATPPSH
jgi:hypothetical protein